MENEFVVTYEKDYIQVFSNGDKNYEFSSRLWTNVVETCGKHNCFKILGIANTSNPHETSEGFAHAELFWDLGINHEFSIAWVEQNTESFDAVYFIETVLRNRGMNVRLFSDIAEAKDWLLTEN